MRKRIFVFLNLLLIIHNASAQKQGQNVFTSDIDNFWIAYDSMQTTKDSLQQLRYIQKFYIDKGSEGLKAFIKVRNYTPALWVQLIRRYPKFWNSVRPNTAIVNSKADQIELSIQKFRTLYPDLKPAKMYFAIGGLNTGGTVSENLILVGTEIATADAKTDVSEFSNKWLAGVFKEQEIDNLVPLNIHEYVHIQQKSGPQDLLSRAIREGSCDFITELVIGSILPNNYLQYGRQHEAAIKESFKEFMFTDFYSD